MTGNDVSGGTTAWICAATLVRNAVTSAGFFMWLGRVTFGRAFNVPCTNLYSAFYAM
jgi:hypothetical protein